MCLKQKAPEMKPAAPLPQPEPVAEEQEIGAARKAEDRELFGADVPQLRVDRSTTGGGVGASGTGLKMM